MCFDWHCNGEEYDGGPYEPSAQQRCSNRLQLEFRHRLHADAVKLIAEMLHEWHEP